jgi:RNA recognition motif-containing protein
MAPTNAPAALRPQTRQRIVVPGKVWVGGLSASTDNGSLEAAFRPHGEVLDARILYDGHGQERQSRGYGFVTFVEPERVAPAIRAMDGAVVDGSTVQVNEVFKNDNVDGPDEGSTSARKRASPASCRQQSVAGNSTAPASSLASTAASSVMLVPAEHIGLVIGRGGSTIRQISSESGANVKVAREPAANTGTGSDQRKLELAGLPHQIQAARRLVALLLARIPNQADVPQSGTSRRGGTKSEPKPAPETIIAGYINDAQVDLGEWR